LCRITGIVDFSKAYRKEDLQLKVSSALDSMAHGGPDDWGIYTDPEHHLILGNRRLSIQDLSASGHMPMIDQDGNIVITYNGEIYNFKELRSELKSAGFTFYTGTDTEVIINAYKHWGEDSFRRFNGMFAFCLYDKLNSLLYLVRDHIGIKPLYYTLNDERLIFSSECRAFANYNSKWEESPDWKILFLTFGHIPAPYTTLKDVFSFPKLSFMRLNLNTRRHDIIQYDTMEFSGSIINEEEAIFKIRKVLDESVRRNLISDAPIGVFLSGGIDSSLVSLIANKHHKHIKTLSINFRESAFDEIKFQELIFKLNGGNHHSYMVTRDDFEKSQADILLAMDQPTTDGINSYFISKYAKEQGFKAVLSGLGADELLGGYPSFNRMSSISNLNRIPLSLINIITGFGSDRVKKLKYLKMNDWLGNYLLLRGLFTTESVAKILDCEIDEVYRSLSSLKLNNFLNNIIGRNKISYIELNMYMHNQLLKDSDMMSMWHSLELRVPFLDKEFMKLCLCIDEKVKFGIISKKKLLTDAFKDILPAEIINRKKMGFTFPFQQWMLNNSRNNHNSNENRFSKKLINNFFNNKLHWARYWALILSDKWKIGVKV
jgi:asparagine synthase (glutamine-hydrolysing)